MRILQISDNIAEEMKWVMDHLMEIRDIQNARAYMANGDIVFLVVKGIDIIPDFLYYDVVNKSFPYRRIKCDD